MSDSSRIFATLWAIAILLSAIRPADAKTLTGLASWYSVEACKYNPDPKCPTASGESLYELEKKGEDFAASWQYPIGSRVRIRNLKNGKTVEATIADHGPNKKLSRILDLSKKTFSKIGNLREGVIPITVEVSSNAQETS